jgi:ribosome-associated protein
MTDFPPPADFNGHSQNGHPDPTHAESANDLVDDPMDSAPDSREEWELEDAAEDDEIAPVVALDPSEMMDPADIEDSRQLALTIARAADERKAQDIKLLRVVGVSYLADFFVIVTGFSAAQLRAIARTIEASVQTEHNRAPVHIEGEIDGGWILQDYGDVIVHIFMPEERSFYGLEAFWGHAEQEVFEPSDSPVTQSHSAF